MSRITESAIEQLTIEKLKTNHTGLFTCLYNPLQTISQVEVLFIIL